MNTRKFYWLIAFLFIGSIFIGAIRMLSFNRPPSSTFKNNDNKSSITSSSQKVNTFDSLSYYRNLYRDLNEKKNNVDEAKNNDIALSKNENQIETEKPKKQDKPIILGEDEIIVEDEAAKNENFSQSDLYDSYWNFVRESGGKIEINGIYKFDQSGSYSKSEYRSQRIEKGSFSINIEDKKMYIDSQDYEIISVNKDLIELKIKYATAVKFYLSKRQYVRNF